MIDVTIRRDAHRQFSVADINGDFGFRDVCIRIVVGASAANAHFDAHRHLILVRGRDAAPATLAVDFDGVDASSRHRLLEQAAVLDLAVDLLVGDMDSIDPDSLDLADGSGVAIERHPPDKDATDLELAVGAAMKRGADRIIVLGGVGGPGGGQLVCVRIDDEYDELGHSVRYRAHHDAPIYALCASAARSEIFAAAAGARVALHDRARGSRRPSHTPRAHR